MKYDWNLESTKGIRDTQRGHTMNISSSKTDRDLMSKTGFEIYRYGFI